MKIKGRGKLTGTIRPYGDGWIIRLDDERNPEFWAEIELSEEDLSTDVEDESLLSGEGWIDDEKAAEKGERLYCTPCGEELDTCCGDGKARCPVCDGPCPSHYDGPGPGEDEDPDEPEGEVRYEGDPVGQFLNHESLGRGEVVAVADNLHMTFPVPDYLFRQEDGTETWVSAGDCLTDAELAEDEGNDPLTCACCGGQMPPRQIWEANRHRAGGECPGLSPDGRQVCGAWTDPSLWIMRKS